MASWRSWLASLKPPEEVLGINRRNLDLVFADYAPGKFRMLDDKLASKDALAQAGVPVPETLAVVDARDRDRLAGIMAGLDAVAIKPARGWGGRGILVLERRDGVWCRLDGSSVSAAAVADHVDDILAGVHSLDEEADRALLEELVRPHAFYAGLSPAGLCDLRIVVEKGVPVQAMARVPTLASEGRANLHGGGVGLGVDLATGVVTGAIAGDRPVTRHPDTGSALVGLALPDWDRCRSLAVAAAAVTGIDYVGVDLVVDARRGPLVLEVNARPGLAIQLANARAQAVRTRARVSRADRLTVAFNWALMVLLAASPVLFHLWQQRHAATLVVQVAPGVAVEAVDVDERLSDRAPVASVPDAQFEELSLSASSALFGAARDAADVGDTTSALALYRRALADSSLAPFALNNMAVLARRSGRDSVALARLSEAVARYPAYVRGHYNLGLVLRDAGRAQEAAAALRRALELKPNHAGAWEALGGLQFAADAFADAAASYRNAIRYDPTAADVRLRLGLALRLEGDLAGARGRLEELLALEPDHEAAAYWLARTGRDLVLSAGADPDSLRSWRRPLEPFVEDSPRCRSLAAVLAAEAGDHGAALAELGALAGSRYRPAYHGLATAATALRLGVWTRAGAAAEGAADHDPAAAARLRDLAALGAALDDPRRAVPRPGADAAPLTRLAAAAADGDDRRARRLVAAAGDGPWPRWLATPDPEAAPTLRLPADVLPHAPATPSLDDALAPDAPPPLALQLHLGRVLAARRGDEAAAAAFRAALAAAAPDFVPLRQEAFARAVAVDSLAQAQRVGARLLELGVEDPVLVLEVAELHCRLGAPARAAALLDDLPPDVRDTPAAHALAGRIAAADGRAREAVAILEGVLGSDPGNVDARAALGRALLDLDRPRRAEEAFRRARDLAPERPDIRRGLARALMGRRRYRDAATAWREVLALAPDDLSARFNLALSLQRSGDESGALAVYDDLLARDPDRPSAVFNRGLALERLGRDDEARAAFRHMLILDPDHQASREKLAALGGDAR